jgi:putative SOS response-associated peptidase YedK
MCGRYASTKAPTDLAEEFTAVDAVTEKAGEERRPDYNVAPTRDVIAVVQRHPRDAEGNPDPDTTERSLRLVRWGLVPSWARSEDTGLKMINARAETVAERPAFRRAFERFRCLIVADGFYEWRRGPGAAKQAFHITRGDGELFAFAGLWSIWHSDGGHTLRTCTILTTGANRAIAPLHDRMPIILARDAEAAWLDAAARPQDLARLLSGLSEAETGVRPVGPAVNDARYDGPDCLAPAMTSAQAALF